ncbi:MAG: N-ethylammeline chlorohydrolase, partial [Clostridia bacterium]|nr:N-ethylammeline chlorohydrolase [Clostridia bacterium]
KNNIISGLVYSATGAEVDTVIVDGEILMEGRKLTTIDEDQVYAAVTEITKRLGMGETEA